MLTIAFQLLTFNSFAQYSKLLDFEGATDGRYPEGDLISDGTFLYGMTEFGGTNNFGTIFKIKPDGTGYAKLLDFAGAANGRFPRGSLISDGTFLYGMTRSGGTNNFGTIFKIMPNGTGYAMLLDFTRANGSAPGGSLISDGTFLYGMTEYGGTMTEDDGGTIFKIMPDGTGFAMLWNFPEAANGRFPSGSLISDGTFLYGMARNGGTNGVGTIFKIMPDGTGYSKLLDFAGAANGSTPTGSLISDGTFLYGMTQGGTNGVGTIFKIKPDGTGYSKLLDFAGAANGRFPRGSLISDGTFLYGMTGYFDITDRGTIFKIMPDGTGYVRLLDFTGATNGSAPLGSLFSDGTFLYGMTSYGGTNNEGTIFKIMPDGTGYAKLLDFAGATNGRSPYGSLISDGTFLYGMTSGGGTNGLGTLFKIKPDGTGYARLLDFAGAANGSSPQGSLISDGTFLYGMTVNGGTNGLGTIFKIMPDGTGYAKLLDFTGTANGSYPYGSLISDGTFLYGMTYGGGTNGLGTIFKIMPDGTGYAKLVDFAGTADGDSPFGSLISDGTFLYGMTYGGGTNGMGTIFKIMPDGTGYAKLLDFGAANGSYPGASLVAVGTFLYGMTVGGGTNGMGTIFKIMPDGTGYAKLLDFAGAANGNQPYGSLISDGTFLYGMTYGGGTNNLGTVFKYLLAPAVPTITSFTPLSGPIGTTVTITGTNFSATPADNIVFFGATEATVTAATTTQLTVIVPTGATYQSITVTVGGLTAYSFKPFIVTFSCGPVLFRPKVDYSVSLNPRTVEVGDFNNDGHLDIAVTHNDINSTSFLFGRGDGSFDPPISYPTGTGGSSTVSDLSGDGKLDLVVANYSSTNPATVSVLLNTGGGNFASSVDYFVSNAPVGVGSGVVFISAGDLDGDGKPDLAMAIDNIPGSISILRNVGAGAFNPKEEYPVRYYPYSVAIGDVNEDGRPDLAVANFFTQTISVLSNSGTGTFLPETTYPSGDGSHEVEIADLNNDGHLDLAVMNALSNTVSILMNDGAGNFNPKVDFPAGSSYQPSLSVADMNGDGNLDLVTGTSTNLVYVLPGTGTGSFGEPQPFVVGNAPYANAVGDFDEDGKPDIATANYNASSISILLSTLPPVIVSFFPSSGPIGTTVTITGTNFSTTPTENIVLFNGIAATVSTSSSTSITTTVPSGATTGPISVTVGCNMATSSSNFTVSTVSITIDTPPVDEIVCVGETGTFTTAASGTTNITYQWQFSVNGSTLTFSDIVNGTNYSGATTATLSINTTSNFGEGRYRCRINGDLAAEVFTNDEGLFINALPNAPTVTPAAACGPTSTVTLAATGGSNGQYRWYTVSSGGTPISGEVNATFTTPVLTTTTTTYFVSINNGTCESTRTSVTATVTGPCNVPPVINTISITVTVQGTASIPLLPLLSDPDNNLDLASLTITIQPTSGALASIDGNQNLLLDYTGINFSGTDFLTIEICDLSGACTQQELSIEVVGTMVAYNALSPGEDGKNDIFLLEYIDILDATKNNKVVIFNRWGDVVFDVENYDNVNRVFRGLSNDGKELPSGIYFYKITFGGGAKTVEGFISLKR